MNHFTANQDDRYWGHDRYHKYDAPLNPVIARQRPWKVTIDVKQALGTQRRDARWQYRQALANYTPSYPPIVYPELDPE